MTDLRKRIERNDMLLDTTRWLFILVFVLGSAAVYLNLREGTTFGYVAAAADVVFLIVAYAAYRRLRARQQVLKERQDQIDERRR